MVKVTLRDVSKSSSRCQWIEPPITVLMLAASSDCARPGSIATSRRSATQPTSGAIPIGAPLASPPCSRLLAATGLDAVLSACAAPLGQPCAPAAGSLCAWAEGGDSVHSAPRLRRGPGPAPSAAHGAGPLAVYARSRPLASQDGPIPRGRAGESRGTPIKSTFQHSREHSDQAMSGPQKKATGPAVNCRRWAEGAG